MTAHGDANLLRRCFSALKDHKNNKQNDIEVQRRHALKLIATNANCSNPLAPLWQQGNASFYTIVNLKKREALKKNPVVLDSIRRQWSLATRGGDELTKEGYFLIHRNMILSLVSGVSSEEADEEVLHWFFPE